VKRESPSGLRRGLRRLTDPDLIGWQFFSLTLAAWLVSFYPLVLRGQGGFTGGFVFGWVVSILGGHVVLFAFLFLARALWLRRAWVTRHPAVVVWTFIVGTLFGLLTSNSIASRTPAGDQGLMFGVEHFVFGILDLCIVGTIYIVFRTYRHNVEELERTKAKLQDLLIVGERTLEQERAAVESKISEVVQQSMGAICQDEPDVVGILTSTSDSRLRPLSHELATNTAPLETTEIATPRPRWRTVLAHVADKPLIAPKLIALVLLLVALRTTFEEGTVSSPQAAVDVAGNSLGVSIDLVSFVSSVLELISVFVGTYVAAWLVVKATAGPLRQAGTLGRLSITALSAFPIAAIPQVIIGILVAVADLQARIEPSPLSRVLLVIPVAAVILVTGLVRAIYLAQRDVLDQLDEANRALTWQVARTNEEIWNQRRALAHVVHGPIRAALISSAMEIAKATDPTDPVLIRSLTQRVSQARAGLVEVHEHEDPLEPLILTQELWAGTCTITIDTDPYTRERLDTDRIAAQVAVQVIEEACANAINHGSATAIGIQLAADDHELEVVVTNDGTAPRDDSRRGLGTAFLEEVSLCWSLGVEDSRVYMRVTLPLAGLDSGHPAAVDGS